MSLGFSSSKQKSKSAQQSTSQSLNQAYPFLQEDNMPGIEQGHQAGNAIQALLGLQGDTGQTAAFNNFRNNSGYDFVRSQGMDGITSNAAAKGLLNSGSTLKGLDKYNNGLASSFLDQYLKQLGGVQSNGLSLAQLLAAAGNTSNSQSTGTSSGSGSSLGFSISKGA